MGVNCVGLRGCYAGVTGNYKQTRQRQEVTQGSQGNVVSEGDGRRRAVLLFQNCL